jgi:hypothetical protein
MHAYACIVSRRTRNEETITIKPRCDGHGWYMPVGGCMATHIHWSSSHSPCVAGDAAMVTFTQRKEQACMGPEHVVRCCAGGTREHQTGQLISMQNMTYVDRQGAGRALPPLSHSHRSLLRISVFALEPRMHEQLETCHTPRPLHAPARHWRGRGRGYGQDTHKTLRVVVGKKSSARSGDRELSCARHSGECHTSSTRSQVDRGVWVCVPCDEYDFTQVNIFMRT